CRAREAEGDEGHREGGWGGAGGQTPGRLRGDPRRDAGRGAGPLRQPRGDPALEGYAMSQAYAVLDADGHVTESYEQIARYLDEPYRRRSLTFPLDTADGWDRRLVDKFHDWAGTADEWLRALDTGGMELAVLYPTLAPFISFLHAP